MGKHAGGEKKKKRENQGGPGFFQKKSAGGHADWETFCYRKRHDTEEESVRKKRQGKKTEKG